MNETQLKAMLLERFETWFAKTMSLRPSYEFGEHASIGAVGVHDGDEALAVFPM